jgi:hypothetical protein
MSLLRPHCNENRFEANGRKFVSGRRRRADELWKRNLTRSSLKRRSSSIRTDRGVPIIQLRFDDWRLDLLALAEIVRAAR